MPSILEKGESIALLDTSNIVLMTGQIDVTVHRSHTLRNTYSHHPKQSKVAVVKTLLDRTAAIPSNASKKKSEKENVLKDLRTNGYTFNFIDDVSERKRNRIDQQRGEPKGHTSIPYIKGVSERIKRILSGVNIKTALKPILTLGNVFRKPKNRPTETQVKGIILCINSNVNRVILHLWAKAKGRGSQDGKNTNLKLIRENHSNNSRCAG